jgi:hypothetical protein
MANGVVSDGRKYLKLHKLTFLSGRGKGDSWNCRWFKEMDDVQKNAVFLEVKKWEEML